MRCAVILCHYGGVLRNEEEDPVFIGSEKRVLILDGTVLFYLLKSQIRHASDIRSVPMNLIYSIKCEVMSICASILSQEDLIVIIFMICTKSVGFVYM